MHIEKLLFPYLYIFLYYLYPIFGHCGYLWRRQQRLLVSTTKADTGDAQFILMKRKKAACCVRREFMFTSQGMESDSECNRQKREIETNPPTVN